MTDHHMSSRRAATRRIAPLAVVACTIIVLAACGQPAQQPGAAAPDSAAAPAAGETSKPALAGTRWQLREIQSMDDAIGTTRPDDPSLYTITFNDDGSLAMRLNCNRGIGPWKATPDATGTAGSIKIGPLAVTRALCLPPSLDERIARDMDAVAGFMLRDGLLSLSLTADAGIYLWEPIEAADDAEPAPGSN